jgi:addiction module HigA family antidote
MSKLKLPHPGAILREEFMVPISFTAFRLAKELHVAAPRVNDIVSEKRAISPEMALRLSVFFGTSDRYWSNLQTDYDMRIARAKSGKQLQLIKPIKRGPIYEAA